MDEERYGKGQAIHGMLLLAPMLLALALPASAATYKWTDANGRAG